jgi:hypothetical protein
VLVDTPLSVVWDNNNDVANLDEFTGLRNENNDPGFGMLLETTRRIKPLERRLDRLDKTNRIYVAINALLPLGENFRSDNLVNILSFAQCNQDLLDEGTLTTRDADAYQQAIAGIRLREETALAQAIDEMSAQTDAGLSAERPVTIVILTGGEVTCSGDPCAAAARLPTRMPYANVKVVSLSQAASANACIAEMTEGRFLTATDAQDLSQAMRQVLCQVTKQECAAISEEHP